MDDGLFSFFDDEDEDVQKAIQLAEQMESQAIEKKTPPTPRKPPETLESVLGTVTASDLLRPSVGFQRLTEKQRKNACVLSRTLYTAGLRVDALAVWELWPINDPDPDIRIKAGERPSKNNLAEYMDSTEYAASMHVLGVEFADSHSGLTPVQSSLLTTLSDFTDGKTLRQKLQAHNVSFSMYQAWLKQRVFGEYHAKLVGQTLKDAIPAAEVQLAQRMAGGDLNAIKFGFEVTGRHDPANKKQVDAQRLLGLVLEAIDSEVKDPATRAAIGDRLKIISASAIITA